MSWMRRRKWSRSAGLRRVITWSRSALCMVFPLCCARRRGLQSHEVIQRERPSASREEKNEDRAPGQMIRPRMRIHEDLNDRDHAEEWERGRTRGQAECE